MGVGKLKVLHIELTHGIGGAEIYTRELINSTNKTCENVLVCSSDYNTSALATPIRCYNIDVPREISLRADFVAIKQVRAIIKKEKPDIVYCHTSMAGVIGRAAAIGLGCKVIYNPHGWSFDMQCGKVKKHLYTAVERIMSPFEDRVIAISQYERDIAIKHRICKEDKISVVLNGVNLEACRAAADRCATNYTDEDFVVTCCGRISEQKDPILFAEVAGAIARECPTAKFLWVGDGPMLDEFTAALKQNGVLEKTTVTGMVGHPCQWTCSADVAVLLSKWEGFGLVLVEYLALGKPVVATDVGAISEIIQDGAVGTLIKTRDPAAIARAILSYKDREDMAQISRRCQAHAELFSLQNTVAGNMAVYEQLLNLESVGAVR